MSFENLAGEGDFVALPASRGGDPKRRKLEELQERVDQLKSEIVRTRAQAETVLVAEREEAYQRGLKDGAVAGETAGKAIAEAQAERRLQEIDTSVRTRLDAVDRSLDQVFLDWESRLVELSMAIARRIVGDACQVPGEAVVHVSRIALRKLGSEARVVVRCHPQDITALEREKDLWGSRAGRRISLEPDESVGRGGVVLETDAGTIDARIPRLVENVERILAAAIEEEKARGRLSA